MLTAPPSMRGVCIFVTQPLRLKKKKVEKLMQRRDVERIRSDESLKITMQDRNYGAVGGGDNAVVVPPLQKHLNRKSPQSNRGIMGGL